MADMGLAGAAGAGAVANTMQELIKQRLLQAQFEQQQKRDADAQTQQQVENDFRRQQMEQSAQDRADRLAETTRQHSQQDEDRRISMASNIAEQVPGGTPMPFQSQTAQMLRTGGRDALLKDQGITAAEPPSSIAAPDQPPPSEMAGTINNAPSPQGRLVTKLNTSKQADTLADNERQLAALKQAGETQDWKNSIQQQIADVKGSKEPTSSYQLQPEIDPKTGQQTGRFLGYNTKTNSWAPVQGAGPGATKPAPGAAQNAQHEAAKHEALGSLDQLDQAIESARNFIGPGAGRVSSLQQMVGSQDPAIQALGTKMLMTKMQVDHAASGTVRAGASPQLLARWDNILGQKVTPEGLKAAVQAMREILGGQAAQSGEGGAGGGLPSVGGTFNGGNVLKVERVP